MSVRKTHPLHAKIETLPQKPGIYFFKDSSGTVIYIGKARRLKDRVKSYLAPSRDPRLRALLEESHDLEYILTDSEREAAFLENNFIQQVQPRFNLRLKDDKSFPYLKVTLRERFPGVYLTRRVEPDGARYFGPFSPASQARRAIQIVSKYFGLRTCQEKVPGTRKRPCLEYDIGLCSAPCTGFISEDAYRENTGNALLFLKGHVKQVLEIARKKMEEAAEAEEFESAAHWRDLIYTLESIQDRPKLISVGLDNKDIVGFARSGKRSVITVFRMRNGKVIESKTQEIETGGAASKEEMLLRHLEKFYSTSHDQPEEILIPFLPFEKSRLERILSRSSGRILPYSVPRKGRNKKLIEMANRNARISLTQSDLPDLVEEAQEVLGLSRLPRRVEGFDVSHTTGREPTGSLVVFQDGRPLKREYRKYKIKTVKGPDDVASLHEILHRRYSRLLKEKAILPDLIFVDGGKGQLGAATKALKDLNLQDLPVVSLAKKQEIIFTAGHPQGLRLDRTSPVLKLLQSIRDEAHRFAVSYHRVRRHKQSFLSELDGIAGLGPKRKALLFSRFKSLERIKKASPEQLAGAIGPKVAARVHEALHQEKE
ncbi:MAG: excinuclease ABC subunit UvrC [Candidatus Aminicenantales bacterium]